MGPWRFDPAIVAGLSLAAIAYVTGVRRVREGGGKPVPRSRMWAFVAGLAVVYVALQSPVDTYAGVRFSIHMVQHLLLTMLAAPLILLGAPSTLAIRASPTSMKRVALLPALRSRPMRFMSRPVVAWFSFIAVMWGSHYSSLYEAALRNDGLHALEHAVLLGSALLFWGPVVGLDPGPSRTSHPARILYLFLAMPQMAFLGLAIYASDHVWYPHYVEGMTRAAALADQHLAGALMWEAGTLAFVLALAAVLLDWMGSDERAAARAEARAAVEGVR